MKHLRLNEVFPDWLTGDGIFHYLQTINDLPWDSPDISTILDIAYHGDHGDRLISPLVRKLLNEDHELTTETKQKLANVIYNLFHVQWEHKYALLSVEYDPISNYDMEEHETPAEVTHTITPAGTTQTITPAETTETITPAETTETLTPAETTQTITPAETTVETQPPKVTTESSVAGFNSSDYVDSDKVTSEGDSNNKGVETLDVDTAGSNKLEVDSAGTTKLEVDSAGTTKLEVDTAGTTKLEVDTAGSDVFTVQDERVLTRKGNIGVTTTQQMAQSEIDLWRWNFFRSVFTDIDSVLTLKIY